MNEPTYDIQVSSDGRTVWVSADDGTCVGRFSKLFGIDVHRSFAEQMSGKGQCLFCTHAPAGPAEWALFCEQMLDQHHIPVPADLIQWAN